MHAAALDTNEIPRTHPESWFAQTLASHNGVNLKFRVMRGTAADFHVHPNSPECFFVLSGKVHIDTESNSVTLSAGQFFEDERVLSTVPELRVKQRYWCSMDSPLNKSANTEPQRHKGASPQRLWPGSLQR